MSLPNITMNFNAFLEKDKLKDDGSNFSYWFMNLKIILTAAKILYVLDAPLGDPLQQVQLNTLGTSGQPVLRTMR